MTEARGVMIQKEDGVILMSHLVLRFTSMHMHGALHGHTVLYMFYKGIKLGEKSGVEEKGRNWKEELWIDLIKVQHINVWIFN